MGFVRANSGYGECREQVRSGVDKNCDRRAGEGDQSARDERTGGLGHCVAEKGKNTEEGHEHNQDSSVQPSRDVEDRNRSKEDGSSKIGADKDRFASPTIDERADDYSQ